MKYKTTEVRVMPVASMRGCLFIQLNEKKKT